MRLNWKTAGIQAQLRAEEYKESFAANGEMLASWIPKKDVTDKNWIGLTGKETTF